MARYAPVIGAIGVGGYAYYDTKGVAKTAIELFSKEVVDQCFAPLAAGGQGGTSLQLSQQWC